MIKFPDGLPPAIRGNYAFTPTNRIQRTEMDSGRARQRILFDSVPSFVTLTWVMTDSQAIFFDTWADQVAGAGWFTIPIRSPNGFENTEVRFTQSPSGGELIGVDYWSYTAQVELRFKPVFPPGLIDILPDYVLYADIFDVAMNQLWPLSPWQINADLLDESINQEWPQP